MLKSVLMMMVGCMVVTSAFADEAKITAAMDVTPKVKVKEPYKALVYHKASGFVHGSIPTINRCLEIMGEKTGTFTVDLTGDVADLNPDKLKAYDVVIFNNTTKVQKAFTTPEQRAALLDYIKGGGGFVAIHAATDAGFPEWKEYTEMVGGVFDGHPWNAGGTWGVSIDDPDHCCADHFGSEAYSIRDELYKYKEYDRKNLRVLATIDTRVSPKGGGQRADNDHALAWVRDYGKGKVFVSAFGHNNSVCWDAKILQLWLNGIQFAAGDLKCETKPLPQPEWQTKAAE
ncbi:MAG: type 1 glutamine amidotransferase [Candidatus Promineifilaceae bacterium]|jgi:type 1 glutamine amidotransferase